MKQIAKTGAILFGVIALFLGTALAGLEIKEHSGFLGDYSQLLVGPEGGVSEVYVKQGVDFKKYTKLMMDQVTFYLKDDTAKQGITADDMKELSDKFSQACIEALGNAYPLVAEPGPEVMRVRVAITDLQLPQRTLNTITTIVPQGLIISTIKKGITGKGTFVGEIGMEFELLDSVTNERLAAGVDRRAGGKIASMSKFGTAEEAFKYWSQRLRTKLDEFHGVPAQ